MYNVNPFKLYTYYIVLVVILCKYSFHKDWAIPFILVGGISPHCIYGPILKIKTGYGEMGRGLLGWGPNHKASRME